MMRRAAAIACALVAGTGFDARPVEITARSLRHSLNFGLFHGAQQVGFARVVTDHATLGIAPVRGCKHLFLRRVGKNAVPVVNVPNLGRIGSFYRNLLSASILCLTHHLHQGIDVPKPCLVGSVLGTGSARCGSFGSGLGLVGGGSVGNGLLGSRLVGCQLPVDVLEALLRGGGSGGNRGAEVNPLLGQLIGEVFLALRQ